MLPRTRAPSTYIVFFLFSRRSGSDDEWQHVQEPTGQLPGQYQSITNVNPLSWEKSWEDEVQI